MKIDLSSQDREKHRGKDIDFVVQKVFLKSRLKRFFLNHAEKNHCLPLTFYLPTFKLLPKLCLSSISRNFFPYILAYA